LRLFQLVPKPEKARPEARGPKMVVLQELMKRPEGISPDEVMEQFGWAKSTVMGVLTSDMRKYGVTGRRGPDGRYRLVQIA
jgi:DNA-binding IclR family transcriptional regulator